MIKLHTIYLFITFLGCSGSLLAMNFPNESSSLEEFNIIDMSREYFEKLLEVKPVKKDDSPQGLFDQGKYLELVHKLKNPAWLREYTDSQGNNALHLVARSGNRVIMNLLLGNLGDKASEMINDRNSKGQSVLSYALLFGQRDIVEDLIALAPQGLDIETKDKRDWTPLFYAVERDSRDNEGLTKLLIDAGAALCSLDQDKITPVLMAARDGSFQVVQDILLKDKQQQQPCIDLRRKDVDGIELMHYVAANDLGLKSQLIYIIESYVGDKKTWADIKAAPSEDDLTPLEYAESLLLLAKDKEEIEYREKRVKKLIELEFPRKNQKV